MARSHSPRETSPAPAVWRGCGSYAVFLLRHLAGQKVERLYLGIKHSASSWASLFVYRVYEAVVVERVEAVRNFALALYARKAAGAAQKALPASPRAVEIIVALGDVLHYREGFVGAPVEHFEEAGCELFVLLPEAPFARKFHKAEQNRDNAYLPPPPPSRTHDDYAAPCRAAR